MGMISLFSKVGHISCYSYLYFTAVTYPATKDQESLQLGNTDFYGCESEEKLFLNN